MDIPNVTLATADITPDTSDFWETYKQAYEKIDGKSYAIPNPSDLDETYVLDGEGKPERDFEGKPVKAGAPSPKAPRRPPPSRKSSRRPPPSAPG